MNGDSNNLENPESNREKSRQEIEEEIRKAIQDYKIQTREEVDIDSKLGILRMIDIILAVNPQANIKKVTQAYIDCPETIRKFVHDKKDSANDIRDSMLTGEYRGKFSITQQDSANNLIKAIKGTTDPFYIQETTEQAVEESIPEVQAEESVEESVEEPISEQHVEEVQAEEPVEQAQESVSEEPAEQAVEEPAIEQPVEQTVEEPEQEAVEETTYPDYNQEPVEEQTQEPEQEPVETMGKEELKEKLDSLREERKAEEKQEAVSEEPAQEPETSYEQPVPEQEPSEEPAIEQPVEQAVEEQEPVPEVQAQEPEQEYIPEATKQKKDSEVTIVPAPEQESDEEPTEERLEELRKKRKATYPDYNQEPNEEPAQESEQETVYSGQPPEKETDYYADEESEQEPVEEPEQSVEEPAQESEKRYIPEGYEQESGHHPDEQSEQSVEEPAENEEEQAWESLPPDEKAEQEPVEGQETIEDFFSPDEPEEGIREEYISNSIFNQVRAEGGYISDDDEPTKEVMAIFKERRIKSIDDPRVDKIMKGIVKRFKKEPVRPPTSKQDKKQPEQKKVQFKPYKRSLFSKIIKPAVYCVGVAVLAALLYNGAKKIAKSAKPDLSPYSTKQESEEQTNNLKTELEKRINKANQEIEKAKKEIPEQVKKQINQEIAPVKEYQKKAKKEADKQYEESRQAIADVKQSVDDADKKQEVYQKKQDAYQKQQLDTMKKISQQLASSKTKTKKDITNLDEKLKKEIKKLKANSNKIAKAQKKYVKTRNLRQAVKKAVENEDRQRMKKERKIEEQSGLYTKYTVGTLKTGDSKATIYYSPTSKKEFNLTQSLFNMKGEIGAKQLYFNFDFNELKKSTGRKSILDKKENNYSFSAGAGGSYALSKNNRNILTWTGNALFTKTDSETKGLPDNFANKQEADRHGYRFGLRLDRMKNNTAAWVVYEKSDGETKSTTTHPVYDTYISKSDTTFTKTEAGIETAIFRFDVNKSSEGALGMGADYSIEKEKTGTETVKNQTLETYVFLDLFDTRTKNKNGLRLKAGAMWTGKDISGTVDEKYDNPTWFFGGQIDF